MDAIYNDPDQDGVQYRFFIESHVLPVASKDGEKTTPYPWIKIRGLAVDETGCLRRLEELKRFDEKRGFLFDYSYGQIGTWLPLTPPNEHQAEEIVLDNRRTYNLKLEEDRLRKKDDDALLKLLEKTLATKNHAETSQREFYARVAERSEQIKRDGSKEAMEDPDFWLLKIKLIDEQLKKIDEQEAILDQQRDAAAYERREHEKRYRAVEHNKVKEVYTSSSDSDSSASDLVRDLSEEPDDDSVKCKCESDCKSDSSECDC